MAVGSSATRQRYTFSAWSTVAPPLSTTTFLGSRSWSSFVSVSSFRSDSTDIFLGDAALTQSMFCLLCLVAVNY